MVCGTHIVRMASQSLDEIIRIVCSYGIWEEYDEEGNLIKTLTYKDGEVGQGWLAIFKKNSRARSTFICFLMILIQGIGRTIYQQAVRLTEVDQ